MVAVIHTSSSLRATLIYNENKVIEQQAVCLAAQNYPKEVDDLTVSQRLNLLQKHASLNQRAKVNSVHISLNFDPSEQHDADKLRAIAGRYMDKIGFGEQPFLVYQHHDAGHPHVHILTTNIRLDGSRIPLHNLGKNQSEKARKQIEIDFDLVRAEGRNGQVEQLKTAMVSAKYGKVETKKAISQVLRGVVDQYKYTSLPELNAVLRQYNVVADRGSEDSRTFQKGGLVYRLLDEHGERVGIPIKASDFHQKPTLKYLGSKFEVNDQLRQSGRLRVKNAIDLVLYGKQNVTLDRLIMALGRDGIDTVLRRNEAGMIYGITYVDHRKKTVFNGSALGKNYSSKAIQERCAAMPYVHANQPDLVRGQEHAASPMPDPSLSREHRFTMMVQSQFDPSSKESDSLFDPTKQENYGVGRRRSNKRKKRKGISQTL